MPRLDHKRLSSAHKKIARNYMHFHLHPRCAGTHIGAYPRGFACLAASFTIGEFTGRCSLARRGEGAVREPPTERRGAVLVAIPVAYGRGSRGMAGFSTSRSSNPVRKTLLRIESARKSGGSTSGLPCSARRTRQVANPPMKAASASAV